VESITYAAILAIAVYVNIGVWLIEQPVRFAALKKRRDSAN